MQQLFAVAIPILPGKKEEWLDFTEELKTKRHKEFADSRMRLKIRERVFLQETPRGDLAIITLEGEDPQNAFGELGKGNDIFTRWFVSKVKEFHGIDLDQTLNNPLPSLLIDSEEFSSNKVEAF